MRTSWMAMVVGVLVVSDSIAQTTRPAEQVKLDALLVEVRKILPDTYIAELSPARFRQRAVKPPDVPMLAIESREPILVQKFQPGSPDDPPPTPDYMFATWTMRPYVPQAEWDRLSAENQSKENRRVEFYQRLLRQDVDGIGYKGPSPVPPSVFRPQSEAHRQLVREYQVLWINTQLHTLPTHQYDGLAFEMFNSRWWDSPVDAEQRRQFDKLMTKVQTILRPYKVEAPGGRGNGGETNGQ